jgi:hypothetical protein
LFHPNCLNLLDALGGADCHQDDSHVSSNLLIQPACYRRSPRLEDLPSFPRLSEISDGSNNYHFSPIPRPFFDPGILRQSRDLSPISFCGPSPIPEPLSDLEA